MKPIRPASHPSRGLSRRDVLWTGGTSFATGLLSPVLLGRGEAMFEGLDLPALGYRVMKSTATDLATHVVLGR